MPAPLDGSLDTLMGVMSGAFVRGAPIPEDAALAATCAEHVTGNDRLSPAEQVDIYRRQFWLRHLDSLGEDYPGLAFVLGEPAFESFCRAYLTACPPTSYTLRDLGSEIVAFAEGYAGFPEGRAALARDMVRYENAFVDLFDGADPPALDPAKVQAVPPDGWRTARIVLSPLLVRIRLGHPVHRLRAALKLGGETVLPPPETVHIALFRQDLVIHFEELDPTAFALLDMLARGVALIPACEQIAADLDEAEDVAALDERVGTWFTQWARWGLIVDIID